MSEFIMTKVCFRVSSKQIMAVVMMLMMMMTGWTSQQNFVRASPFSVRGTADLLRAGNTVFGDIGLTRPARSAGGGFGPQSDSFFSGRRSTNNNAYARPSSIGFGNSPRNRRYGEDLSAFRNLFGQDIGKSAGIYDSFGKPKQDNLALIAQTRPAGRIRLDEASRNSAANDMERYRKHPFSSIRLSPVSQLSGVQVQTPFGNRQRDGDRRDDSKDFFTENRARSFRQKDPFERPISRSSFPLPHVNKDITPELPVNSNPPARQRQGYHPNQNIEEMENDNFGKPLKSNRNSFTEPEFVIANAPADAFVWSKPIGVPFVGANNSSNETSPSKKASLINVNPGDSLSFPKTKALKLPEFPSENQKAKDEAQKGNGTVTENQNEEKGNGAAETGVVNLADLIGTQKESKEGYVVNDIPGYNGDNYDTTKLQDESADETSLPAQDSILVQDTFSSELSQDVQPAVNKLNTVLKVPDKPKVKENISLSPVLSSPRNVQNAKPNNKGSYDVTVLTNEAITKKSGDHTLREDVPSETSAQIDNSYEISPLDVPAIKTVVERTIEDGSETIVKNERRLEADDSGFILTNDLYSDEANLEGIHEMDTIPYTGSASERIKSEINGQTLQRQPGVQNAFEANPLALGGSEFSTTDAAAAGTLQNEQKLSKGNLDYLQPESTGFFLSSHSDALDSSRNIKGTTETGNSGANNEVVITDVEERPPVGSGYLLSGVYFDDNEPPPPPPLAVPSTSTIVEDGIIDDEQTHGTGAHKTSEGDTEGVLSENEERLKKILQIDTAPGKEIQSTDRGVIDEKEELGTNKPNRAEKDQNTELAQTFSSPNIVIEEEHIGLEQLKRMEEEAKQKRTHTANIPEPRNTDHSGEFKDSKFNTFSGTPNRFATEKNRYADGSNGFRQGDDIDQLHNYESESKRKTRDGDFSINTDPTSVNFDVFGAGPEAVEIHRKYDIGDSDEGAPSIPNPTQSTSHDNPINLSQDNPTNDYDSNDGGELFGVDVSNNNQDSGTLPDDFINTGFDDIRKPMDEPKGIEVNRGNELAQRGKDVAEGEEERKTELEKDDEEPIFGDDFIDYTNYEDPYYGYDYDDDPKSSEEATESRESSAFLASPFQSMFGRSADESRRGSFGTLFQNLGQPSRSRGGASDGGGWGLFDDKLGQIIKTRPSLNLFNG